MTYYLVFIFSIAISTLSHSQTFSLNEKAKTIDYQLLKKQFNVTNDYNLQFNRQNLVTSHSTIGTKAKSNSLMEVPKAYSYDDLAIFCKLEVQLEKAVQIPIKFRLGEFNQIERMEGKPYTDFLIN